MPANSPKPAPASVRPRPATLGVLTRAKPPPVLADGAYLLLEALSDVTLPFDQLAARLEHFPSIVGRLLSLANSPWSSPATPVTSLDAAVARLGVDIVRTISIALTMAAPFNPDRCALFDVRRYWCSALLAAHTAAQIAIATDLRIVSSPVARTCGLMHNMGLLWLADTLPEETGSALALAEAEPAISVNDALIAACGVGYSDAGAILSEAWQMPQPIATGMTYHIPAAPGTREEKLSRLITLAAAMASAIYVESATEIHPGLYEELGIDHTTFLHLQDDLAGVFPSTQELASTLFDS